MCSGKFQLSNYANANCLKISMWTWLMSRLLLCHDITTYDYIVAALLPRFCHTKCSPSCGSKGAGRDLERGRDCVRERGWKGAAGRAVEAMAPPDVPARRTRLPHIPITVSLIGNWSTRKLNTGSYNERTKHTL